MSAVHGCRGWPWTLGDALAGRREAEPAQRTGAPSVSVARQTAHFVGARRLVRPWHESEVVPGPRTADSGTVRTAHVPHAIVSPRRTDVRSRFVQLRTDGTAADPSPEGHWGCARHLPSLPAAGCRVGLPRPLPAGPLVRQSQVMWAAGSNGAPRPSRSSGLPLCRWMTWTNQPVEGKAQPGSPGLRCAGGSQSWLGRRERKGPLEGLV